MYDTLISLCAFLVSMQFYDHYIRFFEWAIDRCIGPRQEETTSPPITTAPDSHSNSPGNTTLYDQSSSSITADARIAAALDVIKAAVAEKGACLPERVTTVNTEDGMGADLRRKKLSLDLEMNIDYSAESESERTHKSVN